jgi:hypothetical protein
LGHTVSEQAIRSALGTDPPNVFRTEILCQKVDVLDSAFDLAGWKAGADATGSLESSKPRVMAGVDVAPDSAHVTLCAAASVDRRIRVEVVAAWDSTDAARFELPGILAKVKPQKLAWFPAGPAAVLGPSLRGLNAVELKGGAVAEACQAFADLVSARGIVHPDDPLLNAHVAGAQKQAMGDGWRFVRRGAGHVDAAYAAAAAVHAVQTVPVRIKAQVW